MAFHIAFAWILMMDFGIVKSDAMSRIANAYYTVWSRDPHLMAVGLGWPPLVSLMEIPLIFSPYLTQTALAGAIVSAAWGVIGAIFLLKTAWHYGIGKWWSLAILAGYSLHPLMAFYNSNGMSEAPFFSLLWVATYYFARYAKDGSMQSIVPLGIAIAIIPLDRWEAAILIPIVAVCVALVQRTQGVDHSDPHQARRRVEAVVIAFSLPGVYILALWLYTNWTIMGSPFHFMTNQYGNSAQMSIVADQIPSGSQPFLKFLAMMTSIMPLYPLLAFVAMCWAAYRRTFEPAGIVILWFAQVAVQLAFFLRGQSSGESRYFLALVPAGVACGIYLAGQLRERKVLQLALLMVLAIGVPAGGVLGMYSTAFNDDEEMFVKTFRTLSRQTVTPYFMRDEPSLVEAINAADALVLIDTFLSGSVVVRVDDPKKLVITSDRDFIETLENPYGKVGYVVVAKPTGLGKLDAINRRYPDLATFGEPWLLPVGEYGSFRMFRVTSAK